MAHIWPDSGLSAYLSIFPMSAVGQSGVTYIGLYASAAPTTASSQVPNRTAYGGATPGGWTEVTGGNYTRRVISAAQWGVQAITGGGVAVTGIQVAFTATGGWSPAVGFFWASNSSQHANDKIYFFANFDSLTIRTLASGDILQITPTVAYNISGGAA